MQRKSFADMACPIARSLEQVGEWWSILILREPSAADALREFQQSLGIATNMLTRRLAALVEAGMLERRRYSERPPRNEYVLTERGRDFRTVLVACWPSATGISRRRRRRRAVVDAAPARASSPAGRPPLGRGAGRARLHGRPRQRAAARRRAREGAAAPGQRPARAAARAPRRPERHA